MERMLRPVREAGVDYLTATFTAGERKALGVLKWAGTIQREQEQLGNVTRPARFRGYDCWQTGPLLWGGRTDGTLIRISGPYADTYANRYPELLTHATRIDLQVTLLWGERAREALRQVINAASLENAARPETQRFNLEYYSGEQGPQTVYLGSRTTEHFGRVYDKWQQSQDEYYEGCLRYEVETKGDIARRVGYELYACPYATNYQAGPFVQEWYRRRGVEVPAGFPQPFWELPRIVPRETDLIRKVNWLMTQVRPTVKALSSKVSGELLQYALGLSDEAEWLEEWSEQLKEKDDA